MDLFLILVMHRERLPKCDMVFLHGAFCDNPKNNCKGDLLEVVKGILYTQNGNFTKR